MCSPFTHASKGRLHGPGPRNNVAAVLVIYVHRGRLSESRRGSILLRRSGLLQRATCQHLGGWYQRGDSAPYLAARSATNQYRSSARRHRSSREVVVAQYVFQDSTLQPLPRRSRSRRSSTDHQAWSRARPMSRRPLEGCSQEPTTLRPGLPTPTGAPRIPFYLPTAPFLGHETTEPPSVHTRPRGSAGSKPGRRCNASTRAEQGRHRLQGLARARGSASCSRDCGQDRSGTGPPPREGFPGKGVFEAGPCRSERRASRAVQ